MNPHDILNNLTPEIVEKFKTAIEIGKWANGIPLTPEQKQICMQAVLLWEHQHMPEQARTGYIDRGSKKPDDHCDSDTSAEQMDDFKPLRFN